MAVAVVLAVTTPSVADAAGPSDPGLLPSPPSTSAVGTSGTPDRLNLDIAAGPNGTLYVLSSRSPQNDPSDTARDDVHLWVSEDGGASFEARGPFEREVPTEPSGSGGDPETAAKVSAPSGRAQADLAVNDRGTVFVAQRTDFGMIGWRSVDHGSTWDAYSYYWLVGEDTTGDRTLVAARGPSVATAYVTAGGAELDGDGDRDRSRLSVLLEDRQGATVAEEGTLYEIPAQPGATDLAMAPNGTALLTHADPVHGLQAHWVPGKSPTSHGARDADHPSAAVAPPPEGSRLGRPAVAVASDGTPFVAWTEQGGDHSEVHLAAWEAGASGWSTVLDRRLDAGCRAGPSLAAAEDRVLLLYDASGCSREAWRPTLLSIARPLADPEPARLDPVPLASLDAEPCTSVEGCGTAPDDASVGLARLPGGAPALAWQTDGWEVTVGSSTSADHDLPDPPALEPSATSSGSPSESTTARWLTLSAAVGLLVAAYAYREELRWLLLGLYSRIADGEVLDNDVRRSIRDAVADQPGIHFREVARRLDLSHGHLEHHLRKLRRAGVLVERQLDGFRCFFVPEDLDPVLEEALPATKPEGARRILVTLEAGPARGLRDLARELGLAASTVSHHLSQLEDAGLVVGDRSGPRLEAELTRTGQLVLDRARLGDAEREHDPTGGSD